MITIARSFFDPNGPLGLTSDFFLLIVSTLVLSVLIPTILRGLDNRKWRPLRSHFGAMISYRNRQIEKIVNCLRTLESIDTAVLDELDGVLIALQEEIGNYGFCMNADIARKVGQYWERVEYLWYWAEFNGARSHGYRQLVQDQIQSGVHGTNEPFSETIIEVTGNIPHAYEKLMQALGTPWYYRRPWANADS